MGNAPEQLAHRRQEEILIDAPTAMHLKRYAVPAADIYTLLL